MKRILKKHKTIADQAHGQAQDQEQEVTQLAPCLEEKTAKQLRQKLFLQAYKEAKFNVSEACRQVNIGRRTFYRWKNEDPDFREDLEIAKSELRDWLKDKLLQLVDDGNLIATIFANKTIGQMVETTRQDIQIRERPRHSKTENDNIVRTALENMMNKPKYNRMLGIDTD